MFPISSLILYFSLSTVFIHIFVDEFLPHIVDLALTSSDRQAKVAACELLHSLVLFMLGRGAQLPGTRVEKLPMTDLFKRIFPAVLKLACDVEDVSLASTF